MGVDYFRCPKCDRGFSDCGDYGRCEGCDRVYCEFCFAELRNLYNRLFPDDSQIEEWDAGECFACSGIVEIRSIFSDSELLEALLEDTDMTRQQVVDMVKATLCTAADSSPAHDEDG